MSVASRKCFLNLIGLLLVMVSSATAQDVRNPQNAVDNRMRTDLRVDPVSHGLQFQIPLGQYPGRAGTSLPVTLYYSSKLWNIKYMNTIQCQDDPGSLYRAEYAKSSAAGWTASLGGFSLTTDISLELYNGFTTRPANSGTLLHKIARIHLTLPDGSRHELRKDDDFHASSENITGLFYSVDGARLIYDTTTETLYLPDGSRYVNGSNGQTYIDRNGNQLSYSNTTKQWTDTLGRTIGQPLPASGVGDGVGLSEQETTYSIPGVGGTLISYTLRWKHLSTTGVISEQETDQTLRYKGDHTTNCQTGTDYSGLFHSTESDFNGILKSAIFDPVVLSQIVLPTGQSYTFKYNIYGEITKVIYPTGGYERFGFGQAPLLSDEDGVGLYSQANRGVTNSWISPDGTSATEAHWTYSNFSTVAPDGTHTDRSVFTNIYDWSAYGFEDPRLGMVYDERTYSSSGQMLRRKLTDYAVDGQVVGYGGYLAYKQRNPRPAKEVEIVLDTGGNALTRTTTYQYDLDLNPTVTNTYDFVAVDQTTAQTATINSMAMGALLRTTEVTYLVNDPAIDANTKAAYRARNLLALPTSTRVKDAGGNIVAQSFISYDEAAFPLLAATGATGWSDPATSVRGNATTMGTWLNTTNSYLQTHAQYDQLGNLRKTWDARDTTLSNPAQIEYSSTYQFAYPTTMTSSVPDPSGQFGSSTGFVSTSVFDFNTGLVTSAVDTNNITTTIEYNDGLNRPTRTVRASGTAQQSQSTVSYDDANHVITTTSDQNSYNDNALKSQLVYDALGRTVETRQYEGGTNYIAAQQQYDALGRAFKTSNPFRPWQSETAIWTTSGFDALGRVVSVTTPDNAVISTAYSGYAVTVTDQNGKARKSVMDALGRLKEVYEDPSGLNPSGLNYLTSYGYDTLDNLISVSQGTQTRTFAYDSLKRLTSALNPESGTIAYQYDPKGNLTQKTDARSVVSTYAYDALNRNTTVTYTNDPAATPTVHRYYDGMRDSTNNNIPFSKGRLWQSETSGATASRTTINSFDALGRPLSGSQQFYAGTAWSQAYTVTRTPYNLAGGVTSQTYPSGRNVAYAYDGAGRASSFTGTLGDGTLRNYSTEIVYSPLGGMTKEKFGTDTPIYNKLFYNVRGQLSEIREGTSYTGPNDTGWERGAIINYYGDCWGMCGGSNSTTPMTNNNGNLKKQEVFVPGSPSWLQEYDYDNLNRLHSVHESANNTSLWRQEYVYDRYGNRTIHQTNTSGAGINKKDFTIDAANNRLGVPANQTGEMVYDAAGNLGNDTYTGAGSRDYDAENRMISAVGTDDLTSTYTYDGDGHRVRRTTSESFLLAGSEAWQIYGLDGELLAEYQRYCTHNLHFRCTTKLGNEFGYRNGQLLVTTSSDNDYQPQWLVTDQVGTPRMVFDQTGSLANVKRHDYLPFGEELSAGQGLRSTTPGYSLADGVRQKFTSKNGTTKPASITSSPDTIRQRKEGSLALTNRLPDRMKKIRRLGILIPTLRAIR